MLRDIFLKYLCWVVLVAGLYACKSDRRPAGILSEQEMVRVMVEIYLAEAKVNNMHQGRDSIEKVFIVFEKRIFEKLEIAETDYKRSHQYYMEHPRRLERIYDSIIDTLNLREQRYREQPTESAPANDLPSRL